MIVKAVIEMPAGTNYKYESNGKGGLVLDRVVSNKVPFNYGYIPKTLCGDGDPLDVFVASSRPLFPLAKVKIIIIGGFHCVDQGDIDDKLIAVLQGDEPAYMGCDHMAVVKDYLTSYKKGFIVNESLTRDEAFQVYLEAKKRF